MKYKIYENGTIRECLKRLLKDERRPATLKDIWDLRKKKKIPMQWYGTGTLFLEGNIKTATMKQLKNIEEVYDKGGRMLFLGDGYLGLGGNGNLGNGGRFVGVASETPRAKIVP